MKLIYSILPSPTSYYVHEKALDWQNMIEVAVNLNSSADVIAH